LLEGFGEYHWADGKYYKGNFKNNLFSGHGLYKTSDGTYEGNFAENKKNGQGKFIWNENKYYEGEWLNGKQHGEGIYIKEEQKTKGTWINGKYAQKKKQRA